MRCPACLLALALLPAAAGAQDLQGLLDALASRAAAPAGSVRVLSWIDRSPAGPELVVTLVPEGAARIVGDPGITVTPVARPGVAWKERLIEHVEPSQSYLTDPPVLRLPFAGEDGAPVAAEVEYAWCLVDHQCLFGTARVEARTRACEATDTVSC